VAVIDERPFGGTCALRGCDPKKVLVGVAETVDTTRRLRPHGISGDARLDWRSLMQFKRSFTDPYPERKERGLREAGIEVVHGHARFTGPTTIQADDRLLDARYVLIATGAHPAPLRFPGAERLITSDDFLELASLPPRIVFIGGGYISFEFGHVAARAGSAVSILHRGRQPLTTSIRIWSARSWNTRRLGIDVRTETEVTSRSDAGRFVVTAAWRRRSAVRRGSREYWRGRTPAVDGLDLEAADISCAGRY
jgi:glutathione reductase (NADPH)